MAYTGNLPIVDFANGGSAASDPGRVIQIVGFAS
jgi:hypothetical protein